ncbi:MAG: glycosyltransferase family 4 protein [Elainella sp. Prado103]|jgi:glycosyltransferase involved in cell wall biosynthesis|nr:glycosyltransferase family 4 protein [Elainella sp. Prado103]
MKILQVAAIGMTVKHLLKPQIDYFMEQGATVEIACSPDPEAEELQQQGYVIHPIPIERRILSFTNLTNLYRLSRLIRSHHYDLVHVHTPIAAVLGRVAAKLAGAQHIVYTAHGFPFHDRSSPWEYLTYFGIEKCCALFTDRILVQNEEDLMTSQDRGLCPLEKITYLGNGVDLDRFNRQQLQPNHQSQLRQQLHIPDSADLIIGTIGRLTPKKGSGYLIEAAAQLLPQFPNLHILIIGGQLASDPNPFEAQLTRHIRALGLTNQVTLTGYRDDIPQLLGLCDIFTLPTFTHEGLPRSILEAMAMELPVVSTDIRGCREAVISGRTGFIVPPQDSTKLADALRILLLDGNLRKSYGVAGRCRVESQYDEREVFYRLSECYQRLGVRLDGGLKETRMVLPSTS